MKPPWRQKPCGCIKTELPRAGRMMIRCAKHRGKPTKTDRRLCYFDENDQVRVEA